MAEKSKPFKMCNETIHPGENLTLALPLPEIFSCAPLHLPIKIIHGKQAGPCILVIAAMHGNELNGTEIINHLLTNKTLKKIKGTLIMIPVLNVYGLITRSRYLPGGIDLDHCFPGKKNGNHAARLAHLFITELFSKADICIDLQTGPLNSKNLPQIYIHEADQHAKQLAEYFNPPVISNLLVAKGMLGAYAFKKKIPYLLYEAGEALSFDDYAIKAGVRGIVNVMKNIGMLPISPKKEKFTPSCHVEKNSWVRAPTSGICHTAVKLGQHIHQGEKLGIIKDPFDTTEPTNVVSQEEAIIVGINNQPLVHEGEGLFQLAIFPKMKHVASQLENWDKPNTQEDN